jgi:hypothetical protein
MSRTLVSLARAAAIVAVLQALYLSIIVVLLSGTEDDRGVGFLEDGGGALLIPFVIVIALNLRAAVALWRGRLFGEGVGCLTGGVNLLTVGLLFTVSLLVLLYSQNAAFGIVSIILAAIALTGCAASFWLSWQERDAVA